MKAKPLAVSTSLIALTLVLAGCLNPTIQIVTPSADQIVTLLAVPNIIAPATGGTPTTTAIDTAQYMGTISWSPSASTFAANTVYTATITLTAKAGFTLTGVQANSFTVSGATATNPINSGVVTAVFPATEPTPSVIDIAAIAGVTAPTVGATPVTTITETAQYTGSISWSPSASTFAANTVYTATITLSAKAGFTLAGIPANYFTVSGATVNQEANSGLVTALFPSTISVIDISGNWIFLGGDNPDTLFADAVLIQNDTSITGTIVTSEGGPGSGTISGTISGTSFNCIATFTDDTLTMSAVVNAAGTHMTNITIEGAISNWTATKQ